MQSIRTCYLFIALMLSCTVSAYNDPKFKDRMTDFESQMVTCFSEHDQHFLLTGAYKPTLSFADLSKNFSIFQELLREIVRGMYGYKNFETLRGTPKSAEKLKDKEIKQIEDLAEKTYQYAVRLYAIGNNNKGVKYHNFCHGMFVAYVTYEFLTDPSAAKGEAHDWSNGARNITWSKKWRADDNVIAARVFAALFHDAGHPGVGNNVFSLHKKYSDAYLSMISANLKPYLSDLKPNIKEAQDSLTKLKVKDREGKEAYTFVLEDVHTALARCAFANIFDSLAANAKLFLNIHLGQAIGHTLMGKKLVIGDDLQNYVIHFADVALNGTSNPTLLMLGVKTVYHEFLVESYVMRADAEFGPLVVKSLAGEQDDKLTTFPGIGKLLGLVPKMFNGEIYANQKGFNGFISNTTFKELEGCGVDVYDYLSAGLATNTGNFVELSKYIADDKAEVDPSAKDAVAEFKKALDAIKSGFTFDDKQSEILKGDITNTDFYKNNAVPAFLSIGGAAADKRLRRLIV